MSGDSIRDCPCHEEWRMINDLEAENQSLKSLINDHNEECRELCEKNMASKRCDSYTSRGKACPDCPRGWLIDTSEGE